MTAFSPVANAPVADIGSSPPIKVTSTASSSTSSVFALALGTIFAASAVASTETSASNVSFSVTTHSTQGSNEISSLLVSHNGITASSGAASNDVASFSVATKTLSSSTAISNEVNLFSLTTKVTPNSTAFSSDIASAMVIVGGVASTSASNEITTIVVFQNGVHASATATSTDASNSQLYVLTPVTGGTGVFSDSTQFLVKTSTTTTSTSTTTDQVNAYLTTIVTPKTVVSSNDNSQVNFLQQIYVSGTAASIDNSATSLTTATLLQSYVVSNSTGSIRLQPLVAPAKIRVTWSNNSSASKFINDTTKIKFIDVEKIRFKL